MPSPVPWRALTVALLGVACGAPPLVLGGPPVGPIPHAAECFRLAGKLGLPMAPGQEPGADYLPWIVLLPPSSAGRGDAYSIYPSLSGQSGNWQRLSADSITLFLIDQFASESYRLRLDADGLRGTGRGQGDLVERDSTTGVYEQVEYTWEEEARRVPCGQVPVVPR